MMVLMMDMVNKMLMVILCIRQGVGDDAVLDFPSAAATKQQNFVG
jgi:hypothetical protein